MKQILIGIYFFTYLLGFNQIFEVESVAFKFDVQEWKAINSKYSDFAAALYGNQIVFTTDRNIDKVNLGENNWKKGKHYNIYSFIIEGDTIPTSTLSKPKLFSEKFASNSHTGPICFSSTGDTVFFSRVEKTKLKGKKGKFDFKPQLYMCINNGKSFGSLQKLTFSQNGFSFSHPSYDSKNGELYFVSDIEGGFGAGDIYKSKMDSSGNFSEIENLGAQVNTSSNEMFPFYYQGELFYSSDQPGGFGGLDVYWTYQNSGKWKAGKNVGETLNQKGDEFGINIYADFTRGFIASNRGGDDDIYYFDMQKIVTINNKLIGQFAYKNLNSDASGLKIQVASDDLDMVFETFSDDQGKFNLKELPSGHKYTINVINDNEDDLIVTFYNDEGEVISQMIINGRGNFEYKQLDADKSLLSLIDSEDNFDLSYEYTGKIVTSKNTFPQNKLEVFLIDEKGVVQKVIETDQYGNFQFREIDYSSKSRFKLQNADDDFALFIFNTKGEIVSKLKIDENGIFNYRKLTTESSNLSLINSVEDDFKLNQNWYFAELKDKKGKISSEVELSIEVYNKEKEVIGNAIMGKDGRFIFSELPIEQIYLFKVSNIIDENLSFWLYDYKGNVIAKLVRDKDNYFIYRVLNLDNSTISKVDNHDVTDFNFNSNNISNSDNHSENASFSGDRNVIYFDINSSYMSDAEKKKLDNLLLTLKASSSKINIEGHTDINGTNDYNKWLSQRRSERVLNYLEANGISSDRMEFGSYGEEKPEKKCADGPCTDETHKINRRVIITMR